MQIKQIIKDVKGWFTTKATSIQQAINPYVMAFGGVFGWMGWNKTAQLQIGYANKVVYSYANVLVRKMIEVPLIPYQVIDDKAETRMKRFNFTPDSNRSGKYDLLEMKALREVESHPLIDLLEYPNEYQTGIQLRESFWFNYFISGDGYIWPERNPEGRNATEPVHLHCLPSQLVQPVRIDGNFNAPISYYVFTTWSGQKITIMPDEMFHMAQWSPFDPILGGYSPLVPGAKTISTNEANQEAQGRAFVNGSTGIIIHSDVDFTGPKGQGKLTTDQVSAIKATLAQEWQGAANNKGTHVTNGYVDVKKLGDTLAELQLIEAEKVNWKDGGALFGVSPILVGDMSGGTENNVKSAYQSLVINVVLPNEKKFDAMISRKVKDWYPAQKIILKHDFKAYTELSADQKLLKETYGDADFITQNEKRKLFGFDADETTEGMNGYLVSGTKKTMQQIQDGNFDEPVTPTKQYDYR